MSDPKDNSSNTQPCELIPKRKIKLRTAQKVFVKKLVDEPLKSPKEVYLEVYGGNPDTARFKANALISKPHVQEHITEAINRMYPNIANDCAQILQSFISDMNLSPVTRMKAIDMLSRYFGWDAAKTVKNLNLKADLNKFKLPGE